MRNTIQVSDIKNQKSNTPPHLNNDLSFNNPVAVWQSFKNGNSQALERIYMEYFDMLCLYGRQFVEEDPLLVEDCIQDLFIHLYINIKNNHLSDTTSIKYYLMKSLRRLILHKKSINYNHHKSLEINNSQKCIEQNDAENKIVNEEKKETQKKLVQTYILQLPKRQREAIYLKFFVGLEFNQVATKMNLNTKSVYKVIYKGLKNLRGLCDKINLTLLTAIEITLIEILPSLALYESF